MSKRALIVVRLSRLMDESTSAQRQEEECRALCERNGWEVLGVASDLNVSAGKSSPFERPALREWLGDGGNDPGRSNEFDVIVFWRLDRLVRSVIQLWELLIWAEDRVTLVSATEAMFDTSKTEGKLMMTLVGYVAEIELSAIRERTAADQHHRIISGKYRGAIPSWGYMPVQDDERGWILKPDPEQIAQITYAAEKILEGSSLNSVAQEFNETGQLTPRDRNDIRQGREPKGRRWTTGRLKEMLQSKALLGYQIVRDPVLDSEGRPKRDKNGQKIYDPEPRVVIGKDGEPLKRAEAVIDRQVWDQLQKEIASREITIKNAKSDSLLLNVLFCGVCGSQAYKLTPNNGRRPTYRCRSAQVGPRCTHKTIQVDQEFIENAVVDSFLGLFGDSSRTVRVWDPGQDDSPRIAELEELIDALVPDMARKKPGSKARQSLSDQLDAYQEELDELEGKGVKPPGWKWIPTEETVQEWWDRSSVKERNKYLIECGVRATFEHEENRKRGQTPNVNIEHDFAAITAQLNPGVKAGRMEELLKRVPKGHTAHIYPDGTVKIEER